MKNFNMQDFNKWFNDGNAVKIGANKYKEQSTQWKKVFSLDELKAFYINEFLKD